MHKIEVSQFIHAAHQLPDTPELVTKGCKNLHGHTYLIEVEARDKLNKSSMVVDFKAIQNIILILDHTFINDVFDEYYPKGKVSTAENIAEFINAQIFDKLGLMNTVRVCEGYKGRELSNWVEYPT